MDELDDQRRTPYTREELEEERRLAELLAQARFISRPGEDMLKPYPTQEEE